MDDLKTINQIFCITCNKVIAAELKTGNIIYPHRPDLASLHFWQCPNCRNFIGTHKNSKNHAPLGYIPNYALKKARIKAHFYIDRLWKNRLYFRGEVYKRLSKEFGYPFHVGMTKTIEECNKAVKIAVKLYNER